jgi:hypothetical protein
LHLWFLFWNCYFFCFLFSVFFVFFVSTVIYKHYCVATSKYLINHRKKNLHAIKKILGPYGPTLTISDSNK